MSIIQKFAYYRVLYELIYTTFTFFAMKELFSTKNSCRTNIFKYRWVPSLDYNS